MSNPNPLNRNSLSELADMMEHKRGPHLVESWRAGDQLPHWKMRRQMREAFRDEWRRRMETTRSGNGRGQGALAARTVVAAFRQLDQELEAALLAADPAAMPKLAADTIRRRVAR